METKWYAYIVRCSDQTLYSGSTNNLEKRIHEHNTSSSGAHYTKIRRPVSLVYFEEFETYKEVRAREAAFKRMKRSEKETLLQKP
jgi:putative endonuclease